MSHVRDVASLRHYPVGTTGYGTHVSDMPAAGSSTWASTLRTARLAKGMTQDELADAANVHRATVIRQEKGTGRPDDDSVERLARALDLPVKQSIDLARGVPDAEPLPPPLPRELGRLVAIYSELPEDQRATLLQRVEWVVEWAEGWLIAQRGSTGRRRNTG